MAAKLPLIVMISGARSQIGKSTVSLAILMALLEGRVYTPADLAYIKPATQCQSEQIVSKWCQANGVAYSGIGPVVYRAGFSHDVIEGNISVADLTQSIRDAVNDIAVGKRFVLVDGVGYPSVGSCTGTSNADIAKLLSIPAPPGVGDPIDSINLALAFFEKHDVRVIGAIINRISLSATNVRHTFEDCQKYVRMYFRDHQPDLHLYAFLPELMTPAITASCRLSGLPDIDDMNDDDREYIRSVKEELIGRIDMPTLLADLRSLKLEKENIDIK